MSFYFDPTDVDLSGNVPAGNYTVIVTDIKDTPSKKGGAYIALELTIVGGTFANRKIYDMLNYKCASEAPCTLR